MRFPRLRTIRPLNPALAAVLAAAYFVASLGLPAPSPTRAVTAGDTPCGTGACGCSSDLVVSGNCCCKPRTAAKSCCTSSPAKSCCAPADDGTAAERALELARAWVSAGCKGKPRGPGGMLIADPAVLPASITDTIPEPVGESLALADQAAFAIPQLPTAPPPRPRG